MKNPYIVDRPLTDEDLYFGRDDCFKAIENHLDEGRRLILLLGRRASGKTSFINQMVLRLGGACTVHRTDAPSAIEYTEIVWRLLVRLGEALGATPPNRPAHLADPEAHAVRYCGALQRAASTTSHLVCIDSLPVSALHPDRDWNYALQFLYDLLEQIPRLAVVLALEGHPAELFPGSVAAALPRVSLGPLTEDEAEELMIVVARGSMAYEYEVVRQAFHLSGGEPFLMQAFGHTIFALRHAAGWADMVIIQQATDRVLAMAGPLYQEIWEGTDPSAQVILTGFVEMIGRHAMGSAGDIGVYLEKRLIQVPAEDIRQALEGLAERGILQRLGGGMYQLANSLYRTWLKQNHSLDDTLRETRRYRRMRPHRQPPPRRVRMDWPGLLLWGLAGLLIFAIAMVWRSRQTGITWTNPPEPTADAVSSGRPPPSNSVGNIVYASRDSSNDPWQLYRMGGDGSNPVRLTNDTSNNIMPAWSPDGSQIAFVSDRDGNREVYIMDADGNNPRNVTHHPADDWTPSWSPDGSKLAFASFRDGNWEIYVIELDSGSLQRLTYSEGVDYTPTWSPDGSQIAFVSDRDGNLEIYIMNADGQDPRRFTSHEATDQSPAWSPDGSLIAWESYRGGSMAIYVANVDGTGIKSLAQDTSMSEHSPSWSPKGDSLVLHSNRDGGWSIITLDIQTGRRTRLTQRSSQDQDPDWGP